MGFENRHIIQNILLYELMHSSVLFVEIPAEHIALVSHRYFNIPGPKHITYEPEQGSHTTNDEQLKKKLRKGNIDKNMLQQTLINTDDSKKQFSEYQDWSL